MATNTLNVRMKQAVRTEAEWTSDNPVLLEGEVAYSSDKNNMYKVGDGTKTWSQLAYNSYPTASTSSDGLMSSSDKTKLNNIASGAEVNQNAFSNVTIGSTTIAADTKTDTLTLVAGSNITLTPDATNDKITIAATDTNTDTKVTNTLNNTAKAYLTGTTSASTNTGTQVFDTGVYTTTTAGQLNATTYKVNEKVTLQYDTSADCLNFIFS